MEHIVDIPRIFQDVSVIFAALVAAFGFDAWRREYVGKRRMELAEEVLALFYQARDVVAEMRNSFGFEGEGETRKAGANETADVKRALDMAYVVIERYRKHTALFSRLHALKYRFMAQVGTEETKPFEELNNILNEIFLASRRLARGWTSGGSNHLQDKAREAFSKQMREAEAIFWSGDNPDLIASRVDNVVANIERICKRILTSRGTLFGVINLPLSK